MLGAEQNPTSRAGVMRKFAQAAWNRGQFFFYIRIPESLAPGYDKARCSVNDDYRGVFAGLS